MLKLAKLNGKRDIIFIIRLKIHVMPLSQQRIESCQDLKALFLAL